MCLECCLNYFQVYFEHEFLEVYSWSESAGSLEEQVLGCASWQWWWRHKRHPCLPIYLRKWENQLPLNNMECFKIRHKDSLPTAMIDALFLLSSLFTRSRLLCLCTIHMRHTGFLCHLSLFTSRWKIIEAPMVTIIDHGAGEGRFGFQNKTREVYVFHATLGFPFPREASHHVKYFWHKMILVKWRVETPSSPFTLLFLFG